MSKEKTIISTVIQNSESLSVALNLQLKPLHFESERLGKVWATISRMAVDGTPVELVTVMEEVEKDKACNKMLIVEITTDIFTGNVEYLVGEIIEGWRKRKLANLIVSSANKVKDKAIVTTDLISSINSGLLELQDNSERGAPKTADEILLKWEVEKEKQIELGDNAYISTGFPSMDDFAGMHPQDLIILGGRPGMGKTAIVLNMMLKNLAAKKKVLVYSLEMSATQLADRIISCISYVPAKLLRKPHLLSPTQLDAVSEGSVFFGNFKEALTVDETGAISIENIRLRAINAKRKNGLDLVVIDYLQLITTSEKFDSRERQIAHISASLKNLAKELDIPVLCLCQVGRQVEQRPDKRPMISDLRESGAIEQDADCVMFIYRDAYYTKNESDKNTEIIYAKNRHGGLGTAHLIYKNETMSFVEPME